MGQSASPLLPPTVQFEHFDGPLDLLLDEVRRQAVAIENVRMAPIVSRFLEYVQTARQRNLNLDIDWLHMAATLIHWKSQALLPAEPGAAEAADPIPDELVRQLLAHKKLLAEELERRRALEQASFSRGADAADSECSEESAEPAKITVWDMIQQARDIAGWIRRRRQDGPLETASLGVERDEVSVAEMIVYLQEQLTAAGGAQLNGLQLLEEQPSVERRSCLFLAMLEMARDRRLDIMQSASFASISLIPVGR